MPHKLYAGIFKTPIVDEETSWAVFSQGIRAAGDSVMVYALADGYRQCDVLISRGIPKKSTPLYPYYKSLFQSHTRLKRPILVAEMGYVKRGKSAVVGSEEFYFSFGIGGLNGRANFNNKNSPGDRWEKLNTALVPWKQTGDTILVCGQVPDDSAVQHVDYRQWVHNTVSQLKETTNRVIFRPHPEAPDVQAPCDRSDWTLQEDLERAKVVVSFNSNIAVDAVIAGVPSVVSDIGSMAWSVSGHDLKDVLSPPNPDRQQWAFDLAYAQWNPTELQAGLPWLHLRPLMVK